MSLLAWPVKKFINYVCNKLLSGYLDSEIHFHKIQLDEGLFIIQNIKLNTAKINEQLRDIPIKVIDVTLHQIKLIIPYHFFTESIKVAVSDVDILLMPISNKDKQPSKDDITKLIAPKLDPSLSRVEGGSEIDIKEDLKDVKPQDEDALTRSINDIIKNLQCEIHNLMIRVIAGEYKAEMKRIDIPTFLFRFSRIEYLNDKKKEAGKGDGAAQGNCVRKTVSIGQFAAFFMDRPVIRNNEFGSDPAIAKLAFPVTYPPICHPSCFLVCETNLSYSAKIHLAYEVEPIGSGITPGSEAKLSISSSQRKLLNADIKLNNIDILISPYQVYAITQAVGYLSDLFVSAPEVPQTPIKAPTTPVPTTKKEEISHNVNEATLGNPGNSLSMIQIQATATLNRLTVRVLFDDAEFKRYYHIYKPEELLIEDEIPIAKWKIPYNFFEMVIVKTSANLQIPSLTEMSLGFSMAYISLSSYSLQSFAIKKGGQLLDDSAIYASVHRVFSMGSLEPPNFLSEESSLNQNRFHFCRQKILEIRKGKDEKVEPGSEVLGLAKIEANCREKAIEGNFNVVKKEGKVQRPEKICLSIYEKGYTGSLNPVETNMMSYGSIKMVLSGIFLEFSFEIPLYLDKILNPSYGMLLSNVKIQEKYANIKRLYVYSKLGGVEGALMQSELKAMFALSHQAKQANDKPEQKNQCINQAAQLKTFILKDLEVDIPFVRVKLFMLDESNPLLNYIKDTEIDLCQAALRRYSSKTPTAAQSSTYIKPDPLINAQICRCMDLYKIYSNASAQGNAPGAGSAVPLNSVYGGMSYYGKEEKGRGLVMAYYKPNLVMVDIGPISVQASEIYTIAANNVIIPQAMIFRFNIKSLIAGISQDGECINIGKLEFNNDITTIEIVLRDKITESNKIIVSDFIEDPDKEDAGEKEEKEEKSLKKIIPDSEGISRAVEDIIDIIDPNENHQFNPFVKQDAGALQFNEREKEVRKRALVCVSFKMKSFTLAFSTSSIPMYLSLLTCININLTKLQTILYSKVSLMQNIDDMHKKVIMMSTDSIKENKVEEDEETKEVAENPNAKAAGTELDLPFMREASKISLVEESKKENDSSEDSGIAKDEDEDDRDEDEEIKDNNSPSEIIPSQSAISIYLDDISIYLCSSGRGAPAMLEVAKNIKEQIIVQREEVKSPKKGGDENQTVYLDCDKADIFKKEAAMIAKPATFSPHNAEITTVINKEQQPIMVFKLTLLKFLVESKSLQETALNLSTHAISLFDLTLHTLPISGENEILLGEEYDFASNEFIHRADSANQKPSNITSEELFDPYNILESSVTSESLMKSFPETVLIYKEFSHKNKEILEMSITLINRNAISAEGNNNFVPLNSLDSEHKSGGQLNLMKNSGKGPDMNNNQYTNEIIVNMELSGMVVKFDIHSTLFERIISEINYANAARLNNNIAVGLNSMIVGPSASNKRSEIQVLQPTTQDPLVPTPNNAKSPLMTPKIHPSMDPNLVMSLETLISITVAINNLTFDVWPVVALKQIQETDPLRKLIESHENDKVNNIYRTKQRAALMFNKISANYNGLTMQNKHQVNAKIEQCKMMLVENNEEIIKKRILREKYYPILLKDPENDLLQIKDNGLVSQLGFAEIFSINSLELHYSTESEISPFISTQSIQIICSSIAINLCADSLVATIRFTTNLLFEIDEFTKKILGVIVSGNPPAGAPNSLNDNSPPLKDNFPPLKDNSQIVGGKQISSSMIKKSPEPAGKKQKSLSKATEQLIPEYTAINADPENEVEKLDSPDKTYRVKEEINKQAFESAIQNIEEHSDYFQSSIMESAMEKFENNSPEEKQQIIGDIAIMCEYIKEPKKVSQQYELSIHNLSKRFGKPQIKVQVSLNKAAIVMYDGNDFNFLEESDAEIKGEVIEIKKDTKKAGNRRSCVNSRNVNSFIETRAVGIGAALYLMPEISLKKSLRFSLSMENLIITESLTDSKITTAVLDMMDHEKSNHILKLVLEVNTKIPQEPQIQQQIHELSIKVKLEPIEVLLHQQVLEFLILSSQYSKENLIVEMPPSVNPGVSQVSNQPAKAPPIPDPVVIVQKIMISPFKLKFNYRSYKLSMSKLYKKEFVELLNITDIRDMEIKFMKYEGYRYKSIDELISCITEQYKNDIMKVGQLMGIVTAISPIRTITNVLSGFLDIFRMPMEYRKRRKFWSGLAHGLGSFAGKVANEAKFIGSSVRKK